MGHIFWTIVLGHICEAQDSHMHNKPIINILILHNMHITQLVSILWEITHSDCLMICIIMLMFVEVLSCSVKAQYPQEESLVCEGNKEYNYE